MGRPYYQAHDDLADLALGWYRAAGYHSTREACIPSLAKVKDGKVLDAIMHVEAVSGILPEVLVDVTVRHAPAQHYMPRAADHDGATFDPADKDK